MFDIIDKLRCQKYLEYDESANLGFSVDSSRILGGYVPSKNTILIDKSLFCLPSELHFVQAHELGHFVLHRKVLLAEESKFIDDSESQLENQKRKLITGLRLYGMASELFRVYTTPARTHIAQ